MADKTENFYDHFWYGISAVLLLLAASFVFNIWGGQRKVIEHKPVEPKYFTKESIRQVRLAPLAMKDGRLFRCNDCHTTLVPSDIQKIFYSAHSEIVLEHGINQNCRSCHDKGNREVLRDINEQPVAFSQSQQTCFQCHGPIYRDWEKGVHGRMKNYWDKSKEGAQKLTCVQCHDPHAPKFPLMKPSPAPHLNHYKDFLDNLITVEEVHG